MKKNVFTILVLLVASVTFAQDSLSVKLNQIDEYRNDILTHKEEYLCAKFPLNMTPVDENSGYIDYWKPDTIAFYFKDNCLVLVDHYRDRLVSEYVDTNYRRFTKYIRAFFYQGKLCLEENYIKTFLEGYRYIEEKKQSVIEICNDITEYYTYWDVFTDKMLIEKYRGTDLDGPILDSKVDSVLNAKGWSYLDISKRENDRGEQVTQNRYLYCIKRNNFILPEGVKLPYNIIIDNKK